MKAFCVTSSRSILWALSTSRQAAIKQAVSPTVPLSLPSPPFPSPFLSQRPCAGIAMARTETTAPSFLTTRFMTSTPNDDHSTNPPPLPMQNLYQAWTLDQDEFLWENQKTKSIIEMSSMLGRGLNGVRSRIQKLNDINSNAYKRLFPGKPSDGKAGAAAATAATSTKLIPSSEIIRRINYDPMLQEEDFSILHYDRIDDNIVETPFSQPNTSIEGKARRFVDALPEHRIMGFKYKERVVWDRNKRMDLVFSGEGIYQIMETYDAWKANVDAANEWNRKRQAEVTSRIASMLGPERFAELKRMSATVQDFAAKAGVSRKSDENGDSDDAPTNRVEIERYVASAVDLFRQCRSTEEDGGNDDDDDGTEHGQDSKNGEAADDSSDLDDLTILETLSELVALLPDSTLRPIILEEVNVVMQRALKKKTTTTKSGNAMSKKAMQRQLLPELDENDLEETFVRGSGAGGQKINKTSNRVVLVHLPTSLRVECQDTRSLSQNRKIARKQLRLKLDQYINGTSSRLGMKTERAVSKKQKRKAKNRSRLKKKRQAVNSSDSDE